MCNLLEGDPYRVRWDRKAQRIFDTLESFDSRQRDETLKWANEVLGYTTELREPPKIRVEYRGYRLSAGQPKA